MDDPNFLWWALGVIAVVAPLAAWLMPDIDVCSRILPTGIKALDKENR